MILAFCPKILLMHHRKASLMCFQIFPVRNNFEMCAVIIYAEQIVLDHMWKLFGFYVGLSVMFLESPKSYFTRTQNMFVVMRNLLINVSDPKVLINVSSEILCIALYKFMMFYAGLLANLLIDYVFNCDICLDVFREIFCRYPFFWNRFRNRYLFK